MKDSCKKIWKRVKKIIFIFGSITLLSYFILFSIAKWGLPLTDKAILDAAIYKEFMFKELGIRGNQKVRAVESIGKSMDIDYYVELARDEWEVVDYAGYQRYYKEKKSTIKYIMYRWNYKLNR